MDLARSEAPAEAETYLRAVAAMYVDRVDRWLGERSTLPDDWADAVTLSNWRLRLTPAEAADLHHRLFALLADYRRDDPTVAAPPGAATVVLQVQLMPLATPRSGCCFRRRSACPEWS